MLQPSSHLPGRPCLQSLARKISKCPSARQLAVDSLQLTSLVQFEKTLEATPLDKCPEVCTKNLQEGLPSRVNLLRDGYFQHAPDIGPDDPRHETINNYVADARGKIKDFECTAQDSFAMPQKSVSKPDRGFGKNVRKGKKRKNRNSGNNGSSNKFSLDVPKVVRNGLASMRHHFDQIFRKEPDQKKSGPKYFPPSRPLRPAF